MGKSDKWYPLSGADVGPLTSLISLFNSRTASGQSRIRMTLYLWSRLWRQGDGVPTFRVGRRTMAEECGVSAKAAQLYVEAMERDGWIVRVGKQRTGKYVRRTFAWLVPDESEGLLEAVSEDADEIKKGPPRTQKRDHPGPQKGSGVDPKPPQKGSGTGPFSPVKRVHTTLLNSVEGAANTTPAADAGVGVAADHFSAGRSWLSDEDWEALARGSA